MDSIKIQVAVVITIALAPTLDLLLVQKKLGVLNAAAWLVTWRAVILSGEHGGFSLTLSDEPMIQFLKDGHASFHFFMTGAYIVVAAVLLAVIAWTI